MARLDYQPLFGKMSPHSKTGLERAAEIEPNKWPEMKKKLS